MAGFLLACVIDELDAFILSLFQQMQFYGIRNKNIRTGFNALYPFNDSLWSGQVE